MKAGFHIVKPGFRAVPARAAAPGSRRQVALRRLSGVIPVVEYDPVADAVRAAVRARSPPASRP